MNLSGHSQTTYFEAIPMTGIQVQGVFHSAKGVKSGKDLAISRHGEYITFTEPSLEEYQLVELR